MSGEEELVTSQPATGSDVSVMVTPPHSPFIPQPHLGSPRPHLSLSPVPPLPGELNNSARRSEEALSVLVTGLLAVPVPISFFLFLAEKIKALQGPGLSVDLSVEIFELIVKP